MSPTDSTFAHRLRTQNQNPLILCVIDGNANTFHPSLLVQGQQGGQRAAQQLTQGLAEDLSQEAVQVFGRLSFWITVYLSRNSLLETLGGNSLCTPEQLEAFLIGFSQASPRFQLVEVGAGKEAVDAKIKGQPGFAICIRHRMSNGFSCHQSTSTRSPVFRKHSVSSSQVRAPEHR